ncbi:MAG: GNAT family N-acetyltransferase [Holosporales bacterium]
MINTVIRPAQQADAKSLVPLCAQLGYPLSYEEVCHNLSIYLGRSHYGVAVALVDERIVGWIAWTQIRRFISNKWLFHIEGLVVDTAYRGRGVGKKLLKHVEGLAESCAPALVDLTSGVRRASEGTHAFYQRLGYGNEGPYAKLYFRKEIK